MYTYIYIEDIFTDLLMKLDASKMRLHTQTHTHTDLHILHLHTGQLIRYMISTHTHTYSNCKLHLIPKMLPIKRSLD